MRERAKNLLFHLALPVCAFSFFASFRNPPAAVWRSFEDADAAEDAGDPPVEISVSKLVPARTVYDDLVVPAEPDDVAVEDTPLQAPEPPPEPPPEPEPEPQQEPTLAETLPLPMPVVVPPQVTAVVETVTSLPAVLPVTVPEALATPTLDLSVPEVPAPSVEPVNDLLTILGN